MTYFSLRLYRMARFFHQSRTAILFAIALSLFVSLRIEAGENIIYTPPSRPSHSVPIFERSLDAARLSKLLDQIERVTKNQGAQIGGADAIVAHGFMEPVMSKKVSDKFKRKMELNNSWIFAEKEDYEQVESDTNWIASDDADLLDLESMTRDPDDPIVKDPNSDTEDSILTRYLTGDDADKKKGELTKNGKDDEDSPEKEIEETEDRNAFSKLGNRAAPRDSKNMLTRQSEWEKLMNRSSNSLNTGLSGETIKPVSSSVSSILSGSSRNLDNSRSVSVTSKRLSDILNGDLNTIGGSRSRSSLSLDSSSSLRGGSGSINTASDDSSKIAGPSSLESNPSVNPPMNGMNNIGFSPTLNPNLISTPSAVIGQSGNGFNLGPNPKEPKPASFKQPTILSFPKRRF